AVQMGGTALGQTGGQIERHTNLSGGSSSEQTDLPRNKMGCSARGGIGEQRTVALLDQRLLDGRLMYLVVMLLAFLGLDAEALEQAHVLLRLGVAGGQQTVAVEDRVGSGKEGQRLGLFVHLLAAGGQ